MKKSRGFIFLRLWQPLETCALQFPHVLLSFQLRKNQASTVLGKLAFLRSYEKKRRYLLGSSVYEGTNCDCVKVSECTLMFGIFNN